MIIVSSIFSFVDSSTFFTESITRWKLNKLDFSLNCPSCTLFSISNITKNTLILFDSNLIANHSIYIANAHGYIGKRKRKIACHRISMSNGFSKLHRAHIAALGVGEKALCDCNISSECNPELAEKY